MYLYNSIFYRNEIIFKNEHTWKTHYFLPVLCFNIMKMLSTFINTRFYSLWGEVCTLGINYLMTTESFRLNAPFPPEASIIIFGCLLINLSEFNLLLSTLAFQQILFLVGTGCH